MHPGQVIGVAMVRREMFVGSRVEGSEGSLNDSEFPPDRPVDLAAFLKVVDIPVEVE